ncbi:dephospho-CoA kinase [Halovulum sp. GXIMD14793]
MTRPMILGLTGSIGMGKSTTAAMFADLGCAVWDADGAVHRLYSAGAESHARIANLVPVAARPGQDVDRTHLRQAIADEPELLARIERVIHPLVQKDREAFIATTKADCVILDIPLLFETGAKVDATIIVTADADIQRARVLARPGMTADTFDDILSRQMPDAEKRARADYIIDTSNGLDDARSQVQSVFQQIKAGMHA